MLRTYFGKLSTPQKDKIKWRSHEPSRIEAFSDSVFAFAISLSVISLEVPHTYADFVKAMQGMLSFVICFLALCAFWFRQYKFFRRYGMYDDITIYLNCGLLLMVLLFIYPLKFLSGGSFIRLSFAEQRLMAEAYLLGAGVIFLLIALMYGNAYLKRKELLLTPVEAFETATYFIIFLVQSAALSLCGVALRLTDNRISFLNDPSIYLAFIAFISLVYFIKKHRKKGFNKRFGNMPETEPQLGAE